MIKLDARQTQRHKINEMHGISFGTKNVILKRKNPTQIKAFDTKVGACIHPDLLQTVTGGKQ